MNAPASVQSVPTVTVEPGAILLAERFYRSHFMIALLAIALSAATSAGCGRRRQANSPFVNARFRGLLRARFEPRWQRRSQSR